MLFCCKKWQQTNKKDKNICTRDLYLIMASAISIGKLAQKFCPVWLWQLFCQTQTMQTNEAASQCLWWLLCYTTFIVCIYCYQFWWFFLSQKQWIWLVLNQSSIESIRTENVLKLPLIGVLSNLFVRPWVLDWLVHTITSGFSIKLIQIRWNL